MIEYVKGYAVLAGYVLLTQAAGVNFWQVAPASRAWWILGALAVLGVKAFAASSGRVRGSAASGASGGRR